MSDRLKYTEGKAWPIDDTFAFPEQALDTYDGKRDFGICVSGGGTRSAVLTAGQLRALQTNGILEKAGYLSCVSGGAWASVPFTYLDSGISDSTYLGVTPDMNQLTLDNLGQTEKYSLAKAASHAGLIDDFFKNLFAGDERFSQMIGGVFLKPFNIGSESKFFSLDTRTVLQILDQNLGMLETDFYTVNRNRYRPFLIAGGTILRPGFKRFHFEMTPLYVGTYSYHENEGSDGKLPIGGGYVAPHIFDSDSPQNADHNGLLRVRLGRQKHMFTLSDVLGTTGSAPAEYVERLGLEIGFPEFKYWSPRDAEERKAKEYDFGDGGILENLGIMPLLRRKVTRIIAFANSRSKLAEGNIASSIEALFKPLKDQNGEKDFTDNIVFRNNNDEYGKLSEALIAKAKAGEPAVVTGTYKLVDKNDHYDIEGGWNAEVTFIHNSMPKDWFENLPTETRHAVDQGEFGNFPYLKTFMENFPRVIDLTNRQANLMGHMSAWIVDRVKDELH